MSAVPKPREPGETPADKFIKDYQDKHDAIVDRARTASETTATAAWRGVYVEERKEHRRKVGYSIKQIESSLESIGASDSAEEDEKNIKDAVKALAEERAAFGAWMNKAVRPFSALAEQSDEQVDTTNRRARDQEQTNPLIFGGLAHEVSERVRKWPRVEWDEETGMLTVE